MIFLRNSAVRSNQFEANRQIVPRPLETPVAASIRKLNILSGAAKQ